MRENRNRCQCKLAKNVVGLAGYEDQQIVLKATQYPNHFQAMKLVWFRKLRDATERGDKIMVYTSGTETTINFYAIYFYEYDWPILKATMMRDRSFRF